MDRYLRRMLDQMYEDICEWGVVLYDETKRTDEHSERVLFFDYFGMVYCCIVIDDEVKSCEYISDNKGLIEQMKMFAEVEE